MKIRRAAAVVLLGGLAACGTQGHHAKTGPICSLGMEEHPPRAVQLEIQRDMRATLRTCPLGSVSGWAERMTDGSLQIYTRCEGAAPDLGT
jgi:hypothetical protein